MLFWITAVHTPTSLTSIQARAQLDAAHIREEFHLRRDVDFLQKTAEASRRALDEYKSRFLAPSTELATLKEHVTLPSAKSLIMPRTSRTSSLPPFSDSIEEKSKR